MRCQARRRNDSGRRRFGTGGQEDRSCRDGAVRAVIAFPPSWQQALCAVAGSARTTCLQEFLQVEAAAGKAIYPPPGQRLRALEITALDAVRVVILGQDPYHGPGQAHGLAFSVPDGIPVPRSLANIHKELESDLGIVRSSGNLEGWARQGVLLLNTVLTVESGLAGSHQNRGWEAITDAAVAAVAARSDPSVFLLWGNHARRKAAREQCWAAGLGWALPSLLLCASAAISVVALAAEKRRGSGSSVGLGLCTRFLRPSVRPSPRSISGASQAFPVVWSQSFGSTSSTAALCPAPTEASAGCRRRLQPVLERQAGGPQWVYFASDAAGIP